MTVTKPRPTHRDPGCTCSVGDAVEYHGHRERCPAGMRFEITYTNPRKAKRTVTGAHFHRSSAFAPVLALAVGEHAPRRYYTAGFRDIKRVE